MLSRERSVVILCPIGMAFRETTFEINIAKNIDEHCANVSSYGVDREGINIVSPLS